MHRAVARSARLLRQFWRGLRDWCGDSAYERYAQAMRTKGITSGDASNDVLSPKDFYVEQLNRRYSRPSRCC